MNRKPPNSSTKSEAELSVCQGFLRQAIKLAEQGMLAKKGGPFGAVIVCGGQIVGRGCNRVTSAHDPTAHAEVMAIRNACRRLQTFQLSGCVIYTSCEPCPMCLAAIYWARLDAIYYAGTKLDARAAGFDDAFIYREFQRPLARRRIPMRNLLRREAQVVFGKWSGLAGKTLY